MVYDNHHLVNIVSIPARIIRVGGDNSVEVTHKGDLRLGKLDLDNVLFAPKLGFNLIFVRQLKSAGFTLRFHGTTCEVSNIEGDRIFEIEADGLYSIKASANSHVARLSSAESIYFLHRSPDHLNLPDVVQLAKSGKLGDKWKGLDCSAEEKFRCEPCIMAKGRRLPSPPRVSGRLHHVHVDICGPFRARSLGGHRYFLTCYDE